MNFTKSELIEAAKTQRKVSAYHEAGHAVMDWLWMLENHLVRIDMRGNSRSLAFIRSERRFDRIVSPGPFAKFNATASIMQNLAGPVAQSRFDGSDENWFSQTLDEYWDLEFSPTGHADTDMGKAIAAAQAVYGATGKRWFSFLKTVATWTEEAIFHPLVWPMVTALGQRLETQRTMQASTAIRIMEQTAGDGWRGPIRLWGLGRPWKRRLSIPAIPTSESD